MTITRVFLIVFTIEMAALATMFWQAIKLPQGQSGGRDMGILINVVYPAVFLNIVALAFWLVKSEIFRIIACMALIALGLLFAFFAAKDQLKQRGYREAYLDRYTDPSQRRLAKAILAGDVAKVVEIGPNVKMNEYRADELSLLNLALRDESPAMEKMTLALLDSGADPNVFYSLNEAIGKQNMVIIKAMLDAKGDPNRRREQDGGIAFHIAVQYGGGIPVLELLLDRGARINEADGSGKTALMGAAISGNLEALGLLLDRGADRKLRDNIGKTALDFLEVLMAPPREPYNLVALQAAAARLR